MNNKDSIRKLVNCIICAIISALLFAFCIAITVLCACLIPEGDARVGAIVVWSLMSCLSIIATSICLYVASSFANDICSGDE